MYTFEFLKEHELSNVIDIISQRIQWMDEKGMKQLQFCLSEPAPPDGTQALILLLFYLAFAIPFTFTLRLPLSL